MLRDRHQIKWSDITTEYSGKKINSWAVWYESRKV
jgi:hypothetical protein